MTYYYTCDREVCPSDRWGYLNPVQRYVTYRATVGLKRNIPGDDEGKIRIYRCSGYISTIIVQLNKGASRFITLI